MYNSDYSACVVSPLYIIVDTVVHIQCIPVVSSIIIDNARTIDLSVSDSCMMSF